MTMPLCPKLRVKQVEIAGEMEFIVHGHESARKCNAYALLGLK